MTRILLIAALLAWSDTALADDLDGANIMAAASMISGVDVKSVRTAHCLENGVLDAQSK
jgi:hypothetical protein